MTNFDAIPAARHEFACELELLDTAGRIDAVEQAVIETGGTFTGPQHSNWGPHDWSLHLLDVSQSADSAEATIRLWMMVVMRIDKALREEAAAGVAA